MRTLIGIGGSVRDLNWIQAELRKQPFDFILAADSGAEHLLKMDLVPDKLLGDMDSLEPTVRDKLEAAAVEIQSFDVRKDDSDTEIAVMEAIQLASDQIVLLGSFSQKRPDHLMANLLLLTKVKSEHPHVDIVLTDGLTFVRALQGPCKQTFSFENYPDLPYVVSLFSISGQVRGITYEGLSFPLTKETLFRGSSRAISNYARDPSAGFEIEIEDGSALIYVTPEE